MLFGYVAFDLFAIQISNRIDENGTSVDDINGAHLIHKIRKTIEDAAKAEEEWIEWKV